MSSLAPEPPVPLIKLDDRGHSIWDTCSTIKKYVPDSFYILFQLLKISLPALMVNLISQLWSNKIVTYLY